MKVFICLILFISLHQFIFSQEFVVFIKYQLINSITKNGIENAYIYSEDKLYFTHIDNYGASQLNIDKDYDGKFHVSHAVYKFKESIYNKVWLITDLV